MAKRFARSVGSQLHLVNQSLDVLLESEWGSSFVAQGERLRLLLAAGPATHRSDLPGHVTASMIVVDYQIEHILLVKHRYLKQWIQPGGHLEPGDASIFDAAIREMTEETGLKAWASIQPFNQAPIAIDIHDIPANPVKSEAAHQHYDFKCAVTADRTATLRAEAGAPCRWFAWDAETVDPLLRECVSRARQYKGSTV